MDFTPYSSPLKFASDGFLEEDFWLATTRPDHGRQCRDLAPVLRESRRPRGHARGEPLCALKESDGNRRFGQVRGIRARPCPPTFLRHVKETKKKRRLASRELVKKLNPQEVVDVSTPENVPDIAIGRSTPANRFEPLQDLEEEGVCSNQKKYKGVAKAVIRFFSSELNLVPLMPEPPDLIQCGHLRSAVRSCFPSILSEVEELSLKTVQKLERGCCRVCEPLFAEKLNEWKEARFQPQSIDDDHLRRFVDAVRRNVPRGWDRHKDPYIPNGSASLMHKRREGGNWNKESYSETCRASLVFSSGKPRVVTMYSEHNTRVLTPLHLSLYKVLRRRGWLLVGPPTGERVAGLNGDGEYLSFDYVGATDSIKSQYTREAIEVLIEQAEDLTCDEIRCLRVLGELKFSPGDAPACRGQPMGSVMSFPLLCLVNKAVVDMSLADLLLSKKIRFSEYSGHRCLINGDDLLLREPRKNDCLYERICHHGTMIGMEVNKEKSMRHASKGEINSTLFVDCELEKKVNASALYMKPTVEDVLGFARESSRTEGGFRRIVRANARLLKKQRDKKLYALPNNLMAVCRKDRKIRKALTAVPSHPEAVPDANFFTVETKPEDYGLTRGEEIAAIESHREKVRESAIAYYSSRQKKRGRKVDDFRIVSFRSLCRRPKRVGEETVLKVLADAWKEKKQKRLVEEDLLTTDLTWEGVDQSAFELAFYSAPSHVYGMVDAIRVAARSPKPSVEETLRLKQMKPQCSRVGDVRGILWMPI